jgi:MoaA/NifB/PqqE/SkfB family radical SAM enzyme
MAFYTDEEKKRYGGYYPRIDRLMYQGPVKGLKVACDMIGKKIDRKKKNTKLLFSPTSIQVEPTTKCNLRCKFCISNVWDRKGMDMSFSDFKKTIDQFPCAVEILLQGIGEPLMCKDLYKMIEYCNRKRIMVTITTNAMLLDEAAAKKIVAAGTRWIVISLDGAKKETVESIRIGTNYDKVIDNIKTLVRVRGERKRPHIIVNFTGCKDNIRELPDVIRLAKELGLDAVETWGVHFWANEKLEDKNKGQTLGENIEEAKKVMNESLKLAEELKIPLLLTGTATRTELYSKEDAQLQEDQKLCRKTFKSCFITVDGYVTTCANSPDPRKGNFGNVLKDDFKRIWNGPAYVTARKDRLCGKIPDQCKTCTGPHTVW